jgi:hypothetical protein
MPLPLLVPVVFGVAGLWGAAKGGKGFWNMSEAKDINAEAERLLKEHHDKINELKETSSSLLEEYGEKKLATITKDFDRFLSVYKKLQDIKVSDFNVEDLTALPSTEAEIAEFAAEFSRIVESGKGLVAGSLGGSMAAFGAYSGTTLLASASTGTAISSLSGAAASNATLAWLGGGSLASGGMGMAGGTAVLGVVAAGPALAVMGFMVGAKGEKSLNDALTNLESAKTAAKELEGAEIKLKHLIEVSELAITTLSKIRAKFRRSTKRLEKIIEEKGGSVEGYNESEKDTVFTTFKLAQLAKVLVDQPLLSEEGEVIDGAKANLKMLKETM